MSTVADITSPVRIGRKDACLATARRKTVRTGRLSPLYGRIAKAAAMADADNAHTYGLFGDLFEKLIMGILPPDDVNEREMFRRNYAYAVPTVGAVRKIRNFFGDRHVVEVGAGRGLWGHLLRREGLDIDVTERDVRSKNGYQCIRGLARKPFTKLRYVSAKQAMRRKAGGLFLVWPPYGYTSMHKKREDSPSFDALCRFKGDKVVYIGEPEGGCTGCKEFHTLLDKEFYLMGSYGIPTWSGLHDKVFLFERKQPKE